MTELEELLHDSVNTWLTDTLIGVDGLNKKMHLLPKPKWWDDCNWRVHVY